MQQLDKHVQMLKKAHIIEFRFAQYFDQDDIETLAEQLFKDLPDCTLIENVIGIDRAYFRCRIAQYHVLLHFETYSQSCWLEPESDMDKAFTKLF